MNLTRGNYLRVAMRGRKKTILIKGVNQRTRKEESLATQARSPLLIESDQRAQIKRFCRSKIIQKAWWKQMTSIGKRMRKGECLIMPSQRKSLEWDPMLKDNCLRIITEWGCGCMHQTSPINPTIQIKMRTCLPSATSDLLSSSLTSNKVTSHLLRASKVTLLSIKPTWYRM